MKIVYAVGDHVPSLVTVNYDLSGITPGIVETQQSAVLVRAWGRQNFGSSRDLKSYVTADATDEEVLDYIESWFPAMAHLVSVFHRDDLTWEIDAPSAVLTFLGDRYRDRINDIVDEHDIAYQLVGTEMLPRESMASYGLIVQPVLALTSGRSGLEAVEKAYQNALREMKPGGGSANLGHFGVALCGIRDPGSEIAEAPQRGWLVRDTACEIGNSSVTDVPRSGERDRLPEQRDHVAPAVDTGRLVYGLSSGIAALVSQNVVVGQDADSVAGVSDECSKCPPAIRPRADRAPRHEWANSRSRCSSVQCVDRADESNVQRRRRGRR